MNSPAVQQVASHLALRPERRDERHEHDEPGIGHQTGDLGDAPDVLHAVRLGEPEILVQAVADVVAVEDVGVSSECVQPLLGQVGDRGLAGAGEPCEPEHARLLALQLGPGLPRDVERLPVDVLRAPQREVHQARADGVVGEPVDQDEPAKVAVVLVGLEGDGPIELEAAHADVVQLELLRRDVLERVDVDLVLERRQTVPDTVRAPVLTRYERPWSIGSSCIQTIVASNWSATGGGASAAVARTSPRLTSISSASAIVTDCPAHAVERPPGRRRGCARHGSRRRRAARGRRRRPECVR
jgi:hypothetical protein